MTTELTNRERDVLVHCLTGSSGSAYRNYYCASPDHHSWQEITRLIERGLMVMGKQVPGQRSRYFHCTASGASAADLLLPYDRRAGF